MNSHSAQYMLTTCFAIIMIFLLAFFKEMNTFIQQRHMKLVKNDIKDIYKNYLLKYI